MYDMIVKQWDMVVKEEAVGQFCTKFHEFRWYICLVMDQPWNVPLRNVCHLRPIKTIQFLKYAPNCQSGITNVADEIMNM